MIRDLYGTLIHDGAVKAILITTGYFTAAAFAFARGKPIELVDGEVLEKLIEQFHLGRTFGSDGASPGRGIPCPTGGIDELEEQRRHFKPILLELHEDLISQSDNDNVYRDMLLEGLLRQPGNVPYREAALREVEAALQRIERGSFGLCEACGEGIRIGRLGMIPYASFCVKCERRG